MDGMKDGDETDTDCGGSVCAACPDQKHCLIGLDCIDLVCAAGICQSASCTDNQQNGDETDVDCGGKNCPACKDTKHCVQNTDCIDLVCLSGVCQGPSCTDGVKNGTETDVDCGGGTCKACIIGKHCNGGGDCQSTVCTNNQCACPNGMAETPKAIQNGGDYCIDNIEVTKKDYNDFYGANPDINAQPPECAWNKVYTPTSDWPPQLQPATWNGGDPVRSIDWCDAYAYCKWKGKRLCGQIGGGAVTPGVDNNDYQKDEWYNACSANAQNAYPYGTTFQDEGTKMIPDGDGGTIVVYGSGCNYKPFAPGAFDQNNYVIPQTDPGGGLNSNMFACQGGPVGVYNMSGDVAEWENSCDGAGDAGPMDNCVVRGGSYMANSDPTQLACNATKSVARDTTSPDIGIRCCL
jgi:formylglycine-generating enzyme required for sulfatase activity